MPAPLTTVILVAAATFVGLCWPLSAALLVLAAVIEIAMIGARAVQPKTPPEDEVV